MLDIKFIREKPKEVQKAAKNKGVDADIEKIIAVDLNYRKAIYDVQNIHEDINLLNKKISGRPTEEQLESAGQWKKDLRGKEKSARGFEEELRKLLLQIPNLPKPDVKVGKDESENEVIRANGDPTKFAFNPKDHLGLGEALDIIDVKRAVKVSGTRFGYLKNEGVLLEFALQQFAFDFLLEEGFASVIPPVLIKRDVMKKLGYMENGGGEDMFNIQKDELFLVGTSQQSIVPMFKDEVLKKEELPKRFVGFSTCFRRESGSYGKDTRGIFRVHQFDKIEMVSFVSEEDDDSEHEYLLSLQEKLFKLLEIPYQVVKMCTEDLGFPAARKYDLEAWIPSQNMYREMTSVSTTTDFQARRLNIKYQEADEKMYVHILNGTALAIGRTIIAILENHQQKDGSVEIPKVLQKYIGKTSIKPQK